MRLTGPAGVEVVVGEVERRVHPGQRAHQAERRLDRRLLRLAHLHSMRIACCVNAVEGSETLSVHQTCMEIIASSAGP